MSERLLAWAARTGSLPAAAARGVSSFYDARGDARQWCDGTACHFARGGRGEGHAVRCFGHCYDAPVGRRGRAVAGRTGSAPVIATMAPPVVFRHLLAGTDGRDDHDLPDGEAILAAIEASGLRGRGGAAFPTAAKWRVAKDAPAPDRWVVANGDEGDPGAWGDRLLLERSPHAVLAGMRACARAIGARRGIVYIREEYPVAQEAVRRAIAEAASADFDVRVVSGHGSYVCGEESALLASIAGLRGEPRPKPPYPAQAGLDGLPTVVQNVETLSIVPWIARTSRGSGTKAVCVSGAVTQPMAVEVPFGTPLSAVLERAGGPPAGRRWKMAVVGGPMGRVLPAARFDVRLGYDSLPGLGHGGVVVLDDSVSARSLYDHLVAFGVAEGCGSCTPCRVGSAQLARADDRRQAERIFETLEIGSLCGFGQALPRPLRDLWEHFAEELC